MLKNLTDNAKNLAASAKIEDMSKLFKNHKNAFSGVMVKIVSYNRTDYIIYLCYKCRDC